MTWVEDCEETLLSGSSINVVGMSDSGRTNALTLLAKALSEAGWVCNLWSAHYFASLSRGEAKSAVAELQASGSLAVLLVDDFGDILVSDENGMWLERLLFAAVHEDPGPNGEHLRCVVATYPRDREIVGPGSVLRERATSVAPPAPRASPADLELWGVENQSELNWVTGGSVSLARCGGATLDERRGVAIRTMSERLPTLVGQLDGHQQRRLGVVLDRKAPARWKLAEPDPFLRPLIVRRDDRGESFCQIPEMVNSDLLARLLLRKQWPEKDVALAAQRFVARCGNEPMPMWIDNYMSDCVHLKVHRLADFLNRVIGLLPDGSSLRMLSRDRVGGSVVVADELRESLVSAGLTQASQDKLEWRLYSRGKVPNLHQRELVLPRRGGGFSLPPVTMLVGQEKLGNETDAELALPGVGVAQQAWTNGEVVL